MVGMADAARAAMVGRQRDIEVVAAALAAGRSVLLEGPPGTGKTTLLRALASGAGVPLVLVEGNAELSPSRLVGHHDPSRVLSEGYGPDNFVPGPLLEAMTAGGLLYVEELNRVPEETLNVLLGVLSERRVHVPRVGEVEAAPTFRMVAAMNPYDAVGTGRISPALYDRSCRVAVGYQSRQEEEAVVARRSGGAPALVARAVRAVRATREHPDLRIGSSVRGAIDLVAVAGELHALRRATATTFDAATGHAAAATGHAAAATGHAAAAAAAGEDSGLDAALAALSGRVTVREGSSRSAEEIVTEIWERSAPDPEDVTGDDATGDNDAEGDQAGGAEGQQPGEDPGKAPGPGRPPARTTPAGAREAATPAR